MRALTESFFVHFFTFLSSEEEANKKKHFIIFNFAKWFGTALSKGSHTLSSTKHYSMLFESVAKDLSF